jgi:hypothetical protein
MWLKKRALWVCALGLMIAGVAAAAAPADKAAARAAKAAAKAAKRAAATQPHIVPDSKLPEMVKGVTLTPEQRSQIFLIHRTAQQQIQMIREKAEADIIALLSDEQVVQLQHRDEQRKARAQARGRQAPTTQAAAE